MLIVLISLQFWHVASMPMQMDLYTVKPLDLPLDLPLDPPSDTPLSVYIPNKHPEEVKIHELLDTISKRVSSQIQRLSQYNKTTVERYENNLNETVSDLKNKTQEASKVHQSALQKVEDTLNNLEDAESNAVGANSAKVSATADFLTGVIMATKKLNLFENATEDETKGKLSADNEAEDLLLKLSSGVTAELNNMCRQIVLVGKIRSLLRRINTLETYEDSELFAECTLCLGSNEDGTCTSADLFPETSSSPKSASSSDSGDIQCDMLSPPNFFATDCLVGAEFEQWCSDISGYINKYFNECISGDGYVMWPRNITTECYQEVCERKSLAWNMDICTKDPNPNSQRFHPSVCV